MSLQTVKVKDIKLSNKEFITLIAGPCIIKDLKETMLIARHIKELTDKYNMNFIFKASYDKANRSNIKSYRGPGIVKGLKILETVKKKLNIKVLTDVHSIGEVKIASRVVDVLQVPAFLCRQTDLIEACGRSLKPVNVKKGQFLAPDDMKNIVEKLEKTKNKNIMLTERGTSFGYNNLVVDMRGIEKMKRIGYPVVFDATHSLQLPGGLKTSSGGECEFVLPLARAATSLGIAGLFLEVHPDPKKSLSDKGTVLKLDKLESVIQHVKRIDNLIKSL